MARSAYLLCLRIRLARFPRVVRSCGLDHCICDVLTHVSIWHDAMSSTVCRSWFLRGQPLWSRSMYLLVRSVCLDRRRCLVRLFVSICNLAWSECCLARRNCSVGSPGSLRLVAPSSSWARSPATHCLRPMARSFEVLGHVQCLDLDSCSVEWFASIVDFALSELVSHSIRPLVVTPGSIHAVCSFS